MRGVFDDKATDGAETRKDAEFTLGSVALLAIFFGLVLICGLFFGLGYSVGKRGGADSASAGQAAPAPSVQTDATRPKPSASAQASGLAATPNAVAGSSLPANDDHQQTAAATDVAPAGSTPGKPLVRAAVEETAIGAVVPQTSTAKVAPALAPQASLTVQIAAVYQQQDADVLASALRRRGYAVVTHRDVADNLIHVRIGPFTTREDAEKWRQKLLNDGYNAIIQ
jgi:cell division septation protein DedD